MRIALCPGSYDPVTWGHLNIIQRCAGLFDKVIVVALVNSEKTYAFSSAERVEMLERVTADLDNVEVDQYGGLVAEYAREHGACALVKGLRAVTDFEYEFQMALINKKLMPDLESVFITTDARFMYLSSSAVKEVARFGGDLSDFVPMELERMILDRLGPKAKREVKL
ncbi:pantetheine-phosphate adenylyltransferase [Ruminococcaceae bacterium OttesenSCG-928-D13]|nr:pantetheine-phosphate adenylyltransferase [Ruminococcaceae bacterium OttesenSCG-928-D13]